MTHPTRLHRAAAFVGICIVAAVAGWWLVVLVPTNVLFGICIVAAVAGWWLVVLVPTNVLFGICIVEFALLTTAEITHIIVMRQNTKTLRASVEKAEQLLDTRTGFGIPTSTWRH